MTLGETLFTIHRMVDEFIREHQIQWDKVRDEYKEKTRQEYLKIYPDSSFEGHILGSHLSLQSYIGSDLLIDFTFLALGAEKKEPFVREYWIRSQGVQCIKNESDVKANRGVWSDIVAKILVEFDGKEFTRVAWFQDEDCKLKNSFIKDNEDEEIRALSWSALVPRE